MSDACRNRETRDGGARPTARAALAAVAAAALVASCSLLGDLGPPTIHVTAPTNFAILPRSPTEIAGVVLGDVDEISLTIDGASTGRPEAGERLSDWRLPFTRPLADGIHRRRARARTP
jgi:hypothetical protein